MLRAGASQGIAPGALAAAGHPAFLAKQAPISQFLSLNFSENLPLDEALLETLRKKILTPCF